MEIISLHMDNSSQKANISALQNSDENLNLLAAQRTIYKLASRWRFTQFVLTVIIPVILVVLSNKFIDHKGLFAFLGLCILFLNIIWLDSFISGLQTTAAKMQEMFDANVLNIEWNQLKIGEKSELEIISKYSTNIKNSDSQFKLLLDWYPKEVDKLPVEYARLICQRINIWWNHETRRYYSNILLGSVLVFITGIIAYAMSKNLSIEDFVLIYMAPLSPTLTWSVKEVASQGKIISILKTMKGHFNQILDGIIIGKTYQPDYLLRMSRCFQDQIYDLRCQNTILSEIVYWLGRNQCSKQTDMSTEKYVSDILKVLKRNENPQNNDLTG